MSAANECQYESETFKTFNGISPTPRKTPIKESENMILLRKGTPIKLKNYIKLMHALGFVSLSYKCLDEEELLTSLWKQIGGTNDNTIKAENLMIVLAGIMNLRLPEVL